MGLRCMQQQKKQNQHHHQHCFNKLFSSVTNTHIHTWFRMTITVTRLFMIRAYPVCNGCHSFTLLLHACSILNSQSFLIYSCFFNLWQLLAQSSRPEHCLEINFWDRWSGAAAEQVGHKQDTRCWPPAEGKSATRASS